MDYFFVFLQLYVQTFVQACLGGGVLGRYSCLLRRDGARKVVHVHGEDGQAPSARMGWR
jgi:hypothetical protein